MVTRFEDNKNAMLEVCRNDEYISYLGIEFLEFEERYIKARIPFRDGIKNGYKTVHGGVLYSFGDIVAGTLACSTGKFCTTVEGNMNYLEPAVSSGYIFCEAKLVRCGLHLVVVDVEITNEKGKLLDNGSFTFFRTNEDVVGKESKC